MRRPPLAVAALVLLLPLAGCGSNPAKHAPEATLASASASALKPVKFSTTPRLTTGPYAGRADVETFIDHMQAKGYTRAELVSVFSRVRPDDWIIEYMNRQWRPSSGPNGAWTRYRARHITSDMLAKGTAFWNQHAAELERASKQYGVPPEYIVAIIGIETKWGGYMGKHRIIDALATLAFDYPRRAEYFTGELQNYLIMARQEGMDPFQPVGSFAGAMGYGQFMPSSYLAYAVDFDGNGRRDLWNRVDAIGSVAHYFKQHGWKTGEPVTTRVSSASPGALETGFRSSYPVSRLQAMGYRAPVSLSADKRVSLLQLDAAGGYEYWFGFDNFQTITKYNNSTYYAMTVHQLAEALRARRGGGRAA
ncbi:lytic murein transglycosylase B [Thiohalocapsa sp. ML1]|jgi:membrane-bound lytic murein transglycosylase B|uniref:lytic murein transglycosylase B n=1 Tax=Thiohalocapsa sp. ML1 TaxID=1431688 RepID=UPI0007322B60|nr:lytic murein transglycosylase B [Thiohalocapsa sp. ML1]